MTTPTLRTPEPEGRAAPERPDDHAYMVIRAEEQK